MVKWHVQEDPDEWLALKQGRDATASTACRSAPTDRYIAGAAARE